MMYGFSRFQVILAMSAATRVILQGVEPKLQTFSAGSW
jgi:hypothetical protein